MSNLIYLVIASFSMTMLQADYTIQMNLDHDPRYHVELILPEDSFGNFPQFNSNEISIYRNDGLLLGNLNFYKKETGKAHPLIENWNALVEMIKSYSSSGVVVLENPTFKLPTFPNHLSSHSMLICSKRNYLFYQTTLYDFYFALETENYVCRGHLYQTDDMKTMEDLVTTIANGLHLSVTD